MLGRTSIVAPELDNTPDTVITPNVAAESKAYVADERLMGLMDVVMGSRRFQTLPLSNTESGQTVLWCTCHLHLRVTSAFR